MLLRYSDFDIHKNIWQADDISILDWYKILNEPNRLLILQPSSQKFNLIDGWELEDLIKNLKKDRSFADFVCVDCKESLKIKNLLPEVKQVLSSLVVNDEQPLNTIFPEIGNTFVLYVHDDGLFSCCYSLKEPLEIFFNILNLKAIQENKIFSIDPFDKSFLTLFQSLPGGVLIGESKQYGNILNLQVEYYNPQIEFATKLLILT